MKKGKGIFIGIMVTFCALSVLGKNNFNPSGFGIFGFEKINTVKGEEIKALVDELMIQPMKKCYAEAYPHVFMTKCYSDLKFEFAKDNWLGAEGEERQYPVDHEVNGDILFIDCGQTNHVCSISILYKKKEINVKESFFSKGVSHTTYVDDFCAQAAADSEEGK